MEYQGQKPMSMLNRATFFFLQMLVPCMAFAAVELPTDELAKESVLPKFENSVSVKNKNVSLARKIELVPYVGWNFTEAIFNQMKIGAIVGYHLNDFHALSVNFGAWMTGLSQYGEQLQSTSISLNPLDFSRAPRPQYSLSGNWEITAYYGKISMTKQGTGNISLYPLFGAGMTAYTHKAYFNMNGGVGMKLYFNRNFALRTDLRLQYGQQTQPFLTNRMTSGTPVPDPSEFSEKWMMSTIVDVGLAFLF